MIALVESTGHHSVGSVAALKHGAEVKRKLNDMVTVRRQSTSRLLQVMQG